MGDVVERKQLIMIAALAVGVIAWRMGAMQSAQSAPQGAQEGNIVFVTSDGERFSVKKEVALRFGTIKNMLEDVTEANEIPVRLSAAIFKRLLIDMGQMQGTYQKSLIDSLAYLEAAIYLDLDDNQLMGRYAKEVVDYLTSDRELNLLHAKNAELLTLIGNLSIAAKSKIYDQVGYKDIWCDVLNIKHDSEIKSATFSPDSNAVLVVSDKAVSIATQYVNNRNKWQLLGERYNKSVTYGTFSVDGHYIMIAADRAEIFEWAGQAWHKVVLQENDLTFGIFSLDAQQAFVCKKDGLGIQLKKENGSWNGARYPAAIGDVNVATFSPDGKNLAIALRESAILDFEYNGQKRAVEAPGSFTSLQFSPNGIFCIMKNNSNNLATLAYTLTGGPGAGDLSTVAINNPLVSESFSPNSERLVVVPEGLRVVILFILSTLTQNIPTLRIELKEPATAAVWSPDSNNLAITWGEVVGLILNIANPNMNTAFNFRYGSKINWVAFSPDSKKIIAAAEKNFANIMDIDTRQRDIRINHNGPVRTSVFSPDGKRVVTASDDKTSKVVWKDDKDRWLANVIMHDAMVKSAAFSPDSKKVVTITADHKVKIATLVHADKFEQALLITYLEWAKAQAPRKQVALEGWVKDAFDSLRPEYQSSIEEHFKGVLIK